MWRLAVAVAVASFFDNDVDSPTLGIIRTAMQCAAAWRRRQDRTAGVCHRNASGGWGSTIGLAFPPGAVADGPDVRSVVAHQTALLRRHVARHLKRKRTTEGSSGNLLQMVSYFGTHRDVEEAVRGSAWRRSVHSVRLMPGTGRDET
jgi:hypothetical protein